MGKIGTKAIFQLCDVIISASQVKTVLKDTLDVNITLLDGIIEDLEIIPDNDDVAMVQLAESLEKEAAEAEMKEDKIHKGESSKENETEDIKGDGSNGDERK